MLAYVVVRPPHRIYDVYGQFGLLTTLSLLFFVIHLSDYSISLNHAREQWDSLSPQTLNPLSPGTEGKAVLSPPEFGKTYHVKGKK